MSFFFRSVWEHPAGNWRYLGILYTEIWSKSLPVFPCILKFESALLTYIIRRVWRALECTRCDRCKWYPQDSNFKIWVCWDTPTCLPVISQYVLGLNCPLIVPRFSSPLFSSHFLLSVSSYILILLHFLILSPYTTISYSVAFFVGYLVFSLSIPFTLLLPVFSSSVSFLRPPPLIYLLYAHTNLRVYSIDFSLSPSFNPIPGGRALKPPPPLGFSFAIAKRLEIESWNFLNFNGHSLRTFFEIFGPSSGQVTRSGRLSSLKKVPNHAMATVNVGSVWNWQDCLVISVSTKCMPKNVYPGDLRSGQFRDLPIISLWGNMKILPVSHKPIKTSHFFRDHGRSPHLCRSGMQLTIWDHGEVTCGQMTSQSVFRQ